MSSLEIRKRLAEVGAPGLLVRTFCRHVDSLRRGITGFIPDAELEPVTNLPDLAAAHAHAPRGREELHQAVVIKLNGGLGTGMGLEKAKSLLPVKGGSTFLDIIAGQILHLRKETDCSLPLLLMNSEHTRHDTAKALARHPELQAGQSDLPLGFLQHRVPKLARETLSPVTWPHNPALEWCPPGHGDLYIAMAASGLLDRLLNKGLRYAFISNADNLGATLDPGILGFFAEQGLPFLMEVTRRTAADRKGGHLALTPGGELLLRERAQCPPDDLAQFEDITRYRFFNTNNLWVNLEALKEALATEEGLRLPVIVNEKTVDPRDTSSARVLQLETAMGAAIGCFAGAQAIDVPRTRFAPVKTTDDLLTVWSDVYELTSEMNMAMKPEREGSPPVVRLDPRFYRLFGDFQTRFPHGAPSMLLCDSLTVEGDFIFGANTRLEGDVYLQNPGASAVTIADGSVLR